MATCVPLRAPMKRAGNTALSGLQKTLNQVSFTPMSRLPPLERGYSYCIVMQSDVQREELLQELSAQREAVVVAHDGGLISNLNIWENLSLPIHYHSSQIGDGLEGKVVELFRQCGLPGDAEVRLLLGKLPGELPLYEKRLAGFVRAMLVEPELMVYDRIYDGLARDDAERVAHFDKLFHLYFPFRISVLLSFDECKEMGNTRQHIIHL